MELDLSKIDVGTIYNVEAILKSVPTMGMFEITDYTNSIKVFTNAVNSITFDYKQHLNNKILVHGMVIPIGATTEKGLLLQGISVAKPTVTISETNYDILVKKIQHLKQEIQSTITGSQFSLSPIFKSGLSLNDQIVSTAQQSSVTMSNIIKSCFVKQLEELLK